MKLEVGMYVRTDKGIIGKIYEKIGDMFSYKNNNRDYITYGGLHNEILKASHNIVDLIEVGDYVNGYLVTERFYDYANDEWNIVIVTTRHLKIGKNRNDIKSIVTKEQFESMSYKLGDNK